MQRIKVLHIITHLGVGGGLDNTLLTVKGLPRERFEVHLAAGELESEERYSDWSARAEEYSDVLHTFPDLCRPVDIRRDMAALRQMIKFIKNQNYQIVHTHYAKAGLLGRIAAKRAGVPIIVHTYHTFSWKVAHVFHSARWRNALSSVKEQFYVVLERYAASLCNALITVCELNKKEAVERKIAPADKIKTIYSGIDFDRFQPPAIDKNKLCEKFGLDPHAPIIGTVGRLSVQKSPLDFVKAAGMVLKRHPEAQFLIVGDGPLELQTRTAIESEPRIKMTGFYENIPEILALIDIFALSSLWEGLGRALTEAMTMARPVAVTAAGGVPELVIHGETGLLSSPGNPRELADHIIRLLDDPVEAGRMGEKARHRVLSDFSKETMVERIDRLYQDLLGGNGSYAVHNESGQQAPEEKPGV